MRNSAAGRKAIASILFVLCAGLLTTGAQVISLGGAENVTVLGATTVTNTGETIIYGNLALTPGTSVTGFPPGQVINGSIHINDAIANQAHAGALAAYNQIAGETPTSNLTGMNLSGMTLSPGIYRFATFAQLSGTLTLDTGGDPNAPFHFQIGSTLTTDPGSQVSLLNGNSLNIFWQVGSSATLGTNSTFFGNIIANQSITMNNGATLEGRLLALNGAVTLDNNIIRQPTGATPTPSPTPGPTATPSPTATPAPTATPTPSPTATPAPTATPSATPGPTASPTATPGPTATPTATPGPTATPSATPGGSATPSPTATPGATATPTPAPSPIAAATPTPLTPNELIIVRAIDRLPIDHPLVGILTNLPLANIPGALILLSPADLASIFTGGFSVLHVPRHNIELRLTEVRQGTSGFSDSSYRVTDMRQTDGKEMLSSDGKEVVSMPPTRNGAPVDKRWGFYIAGSGELVDVESTGTARGSSFNTAGMSVGADYRVSDRFVLGAALSYSNFDADLNLGGSLESNGAQASLYGTYYDRGFYVNGIVGGGVSSIETRRLTIGGFAEGDTDTSGFDATIGAGYDYRVGAFRFGPLASLRFGRVGIDGFREEGALGALYIDGQSQDSVQSAIGLQASYTARVGGITLTPIVRAQWEHEFRSTTPGIRAAFIPGDSFEVDGAHIGRDGLLLDVGASAQLTPTLSIFTYYRAELGRKNYNVHSVSGGVRWSF